MPDPRPPTSFALWLEEALTGWIVPVAALLLLGAAGVLYAAGLLPEGTTAAVIAVLASLLAAVLVARPALSPRGDGAGRALAAVAAAGALVLGALPAVETVAPGRALLAGDLPARGATLPVPPGLSGHVRLLASVPLPQGGTPTVTFRVTGTEPPAEAKLERTLSYARVGRGGRTAVSHDHSAAFVAARLPDGTPALVLDRLQGEPAGPLHLALYRDLLPPALHWTLAALVVLAAALADARLRSGSGAALAGMAVAFGLFVADNATPAAAVGTTVGAILLGAMSGAAAGGIAGAIAKRLVPAAAPARGARAA